MAVILKRNDIDSVLICGQTGIWKSWHIGLFSGNSAANDLQVFQNVPVSYTFTYKVALYTTAVQQIQF